jgi:hypothetical protein
MSKPYNPRAWFWLAEDGRVFGSAASKTTDVEDDAYKAWSEDGSVATPWPRDDAGKQTDAALDDVLAPYGLATGTAVPSEVTSAQAKIQLSRAKFLPAVKASVEAIGGEVEIWFTDARTWQRNNPHVNEIGAGLNLSASEIDDLFRAAAQIAA